jgi:hypothetical protein
MNEVHRPSLVRMRGHNAVVPQLRLHPALGRFVAQLQAQFTIDAPRLVPAMGAPLAPKQNMNPPIAIAHPRLANLSDPLLEEGLSGATRLVMVGGRIDQEDTACSPDRHIPVATHLID